MTGDDGRVTVTRRAFERLFSRLAAEELAVRAADVQVTVADEHGRLAVQVHGPVRLSGAGGDSVLERARAARERVLGDGASLSGAVLADARVRISAAGSDAPERVR